MKNIIYKNIVLQVEGLIKLNLKIIDDFIKYNKIFNKELYYNTENL